MVTVDLTAAVICFLGNCYPILHGPATPIGEFKMSQRIVQAPGYGGDVLQFAENEKMIFAIHRVWTLDPKQRRMERLETPSISDNVVTNGCINVKPEVYNKLIECCRRDTLVIKR